MMSDDIKKIQNTDVFDKEVSDIVDEYVESDKFFDKVKHYYNFEISEEELLDTEPKKVNLFDKETNDYISTLYLNNYYIKLFSNILQDKYKIVITQ